MPHDAWHARGPRFHRTSASHTLQGPGSQVSPKKRGARAPRGERHNVSSPNLPLPAAQCRPANIFYCLGQAWSQTQQCSARLGCGLLELFVVGQTWRTAQPTLVFPCGMWFWTSSSPLKRWTKTARRAQCSASFAYLTGPSLDLQRPEPGTTCGQSHGHNAARARDAIRIDSTPLLWPALVVWTQSLPAFLLTGASQEPPPPRLPACRDECPGVLRRGLHCARRCAQFGRAESM